MNVQVRQVITTLLQHKGYIGFAYSRPVASIGEHQAYFQIDFNDPLPGDEERYTLNGTERQLLEQVGALPNRQ
jgi:hypothetical protein